MMIGTTARRARSARATSWPARPAASATSRSTTSKSCSAARASASVPSGTAVTRWPSRSNERVSMSRNGSSSSTTRMSRADVVCMPDGQYRPPARRRAVGRGARPRGSPDRGPSERSSSVSTAVLALVVLAALAHAAWNVLAKTAAGGATFVWLFSALAAAIWLPVAAVALVVDGGEPVGLEGIGFMAGSGALHALYFVLLQRGYRDGDLSLVYPLARGTGPLL